MKQQFNIASGIIFALIMVMHACDGVKGNQTNTTQPGTVNFNDTTIIKSIVWDSLNAFVDLHILNNGNIASDSEFLFSVRSIAVYHYYNKQFELINDPTIIKLTPAELQEFILSDSFSNRRNFDCFIRINTQIGFHYRPDLLTQVTVMPKDTNEKNIESFMADLKRENFVESLTSEIHRDTFFDEPRELAYINIKLRSAYWDLEKIKEICSQLNERPDVDQAFFTDFFTGPNEGEMLYHLTSE